jgi:anti-anti-sigma factor
MSVYHHLGVWEYGSVIAIRFGEHRILDEGTVKKLADELYEVADRRDCQCLVVNLASVVGLSSLMLGKLLMLQRKMASKGGKLILCALGPEVRDLIQSTKLELLFQIEESELDGVRAFSGVVSDPIQGG